MNKRFRLIDSDGNPKEVDLLSFLKSVNDNIEFNDDGTIVFHVSRPTQRAADGAKWRCPKCEAMNYGDCWKCGEPQPPRR